jgi:hypothetical protein
MVVPALSLRSKGIPLEPRKVDRPSCLFRERAACVQAPVFNQARFYTLEYTKFRSRVVSSYRPRFMPLQWIQ